METGFISSNIGYVNVDNEIIGKNSLSLENTLRFLEELAGQAQAEDFILNN